ncbi:hypothetical protein M9H77_34430 [Catharanthus roseus]|uniref:Uncharacterized protein n=1 Tax=Catharanthus roseus TaxID=4058 RepID=A0ACB9ZLE5_CATRO|nr:hypothetical protein M9H77_34430 [Catharanthus roseus]
MEKKFFCILLLLFIVSISYEGGVVKFGEGKMCGSPSDKFRWLCVDHQKCVAICESEGFEYGKCEGLRRRCICFKACPL